MNDEKDGPAWWASPLSAKIVKKALILSSKLYVYWFMIIWQLLLGTLLQIWEITPAFSNAQQTKTVPIQERNTNKNKKLNKKQQQ